MPKTKEEKNTLKEFDKEYGGDKGKQVYYALRNKNKKFDRSQGGGFSSSNKKKKSASWWAARVSKLPKASQKAQLMKALPLDVRELIKIK